MVYPDQNYKSECHHCLTIRLTRPRSLTLAVLMTTATALSAAIPTKRIGQYSTPSKSRSHSSIEALQMALYQLPLSANNAQTLPTVGLALLTT